MLEDDEKQFEEENVFRQVSLEINNKGEFRKACVLMGDFRKGF